MDIGAKKINQPTIKGLFVNSHVQALAADEGNDAIVKLQELFGASITFGKLADVPVVTEVKLLDCIVCLKHGVGYPEKMRDFEAGKLHFENFSRTSVGKVLMMQSKLSPKLILMWTQNIGSHIFSGMRFVSEDIGKHTVRLRIERCAYPLEHFHGFLEAWLSELGLIGSVTAEQFEAGTCDYLIDWH